MVQALTERERELSRRFTELADRKTTLAAELGMHKGQVEKTRPHPVDLVRFPWHLLRHCKGL